MTPSSALASGHPLGKRRLPVILGVVIASTLLTYSEILLPWLPLPVPSSALGWIFPLLAALVFFAPLIRRPTFPTRLWLPWFFLLTYYGVTADAANAVQRTIMLAVPLAVGAAASALRPRPTQLARFGVWMKWASVVLLLATAIATSLLQNLQLGGITGFVTGAMTACALACWFSARFAADERRALLWWGLLALVPFVALARMATLAVVVTLPLTLAPLKWRWRLFFLSAIAFVGVTLFESPRVQAKMFYGGEGGTIADAATGILAMLKGEGSGRFATTGRWHINSVLLEGIAEAPWLGHGANASEAVVKEISGMTHPHNDWLRLRYDYGWVGTIVFAASMAAQVYHAVRTARRVGGEAAICLSAGATAFLPMALLMFTDNIILYASFFGNLHFLILGLGYAAAFVQERQGFHQTQSLPFRKGQ